MMEEFAGLPPDLKENPYNLYVLVSDKETVADCIKSFISRFGKNPEKVYRQGQRVWLGPLEKGRI